MQELLFWVFGLLGFRILCFCQKLKIASVVLLWFWCFQIFLIFRNSKMQTCFLFSFSGILDFQQTCKRSSLHFLIFVFLWNFKIVWSSLFKKSKTRMLCFWNILGFVFLLTSFIQKLNTCKCNFWISWVSEFLFFLFRKFEICDVVFCFFFILGILVFP